MNVPDLQGKKRDPANSCVTTYHQILAWPAIRNQQVVGSNPTGGSRKSSKIEHL